MTPTAIRNRRWRGRSKALRDEHHQAAMRLVVASLNTMAGIPRGEPPKVKEIRKLVAISFGLTKEQLMARSKQIEWVVPRQFAMALSYAVCDRSLCFIASFYERDHTTVMCARRKYDDKIKQLLAEVIARQQHGGPVADTLAPSFDSRPSIPLEKAA